MGTIEIAIRAEWAAIALLGVVGYAMTDGSWWIFALLILAPDLSFLGYLAGPRAGAAAYNALHVLFAPLLLLIAGLWLGNGTALQVALIWAVHVAVDRMLGYGLKLPTGFRDTHLGRIGRD